MYFPLYTIEDDTRWIRVAAEFFCYVSPDI